MIEWLNKYNMKIAIQYTTLYVCFIVIQMYGCIPGVVLICMVKIHKIITCSLGVSKCQMFNFR